MSIAGSTPIAAVLPTLLCAAALLGLASCASSDVSSIKAASQEEIRSIRVSEVNVTLATPKPNDALEAALREELESAMPLCATGTVEHRLDVIVTDFESQHVGKAIFLGDEIELEGRAEFTELASGQQTGAYFVENSFAWGGFIGAAMMSDAEVSLSKGFAEQLCKNVFEKDLVQLRKGQG